MDIGEAISSAVASALPPSQDNVAADDAEETLAPDAEGDGSDDGDASYDSEESEESGATVNLPEGYVAVPTVTDDLATEFALHDADGEVEVPNLMVEYKANGKMRHDRLDQVVKLAQWGVYNQEREQKVQQVEQVAQQVYQEREELAALLSEREAQIEKLLMDDDFLLAVRDAYGEQNSPESRAARAEQEVQDIRVQHQMSAIAEKGQAFYENEVMPALDMIAGALPSISMDELAEKFQMAMYAHVERAPNGEAYIPASRYDAVRQYILDDLAVWAQGQHGRRSGTTTSAPKQETQKALAERDKARIEAQKAKRAVGQKTLPVGNAGKPSGKPKVNAGNTVDDAVASALSSALSSFR
jgi:hypothetical protein